MVIINKWLIFAFTVNCLQSTINYTFIQKTIFLTNTPVLDQSILPIEK